MIVVWKEVLGGKPASRYPAFRASIIDGALRCGRSVMQHQLMTQQLRAL